MGVSGRPERCMRNRTIAAAAFELQSRTKMRVHAALTTCGVLKLLVTH